MTSIIKNQIIKHLSKFVKNLSPDKINLSTLRGEGDLTNLELDEKILTELLELPNWLSLQKAWCNRVSIRIPWTKLKSVPLCLNLDEVILAMETSTEVRKPSMSQKPPSYATGGKYGFSDKVIDGVTLRVNSVVINFKSPAFEASLQLSRILLESCSPSWQPAELRFSRLKDIDQGFILLFKELQWQTLRLEARSKTDTSLPPLRLITNLSRCRMTIKKRLSDCAVMGCRLVLIMDELLWVLTDAQLTSAMLFVQSLAHLIEQDTVPNQRVKAARKLETLPEYRAQQQQQQQHRSGQTSTQKMPTALSRVFARYDVSETSYHFFSEKIDLHFCDDPGDGRSVHPDLKEGGALQVTLSQLQVDYYPYHWSGPEGNTRKHWIRYEEGPVSRWMQQGLDQFSKQLLHFDSPTHSKLTRSPAGDGMASVNPRSTSATTSNPLQESILTQLRQLMATCMVLRLGDLLVYRVSTAKSRQTPKEFVLAQERKRRRHTGDRSRYALPEGMPIIHIELSQYYYPGDLEFPLPQPKCFILVNPLQVNFDGLTLLWLHSFSKSLEKTLTAYPLVTQVPGTITPQVDVRLEALLPRVVMELAGWDRPKSLQFQSSRVICTNHRSVDGGSRADLATCLERIQGQDHGTGPKYSSLCFTSSFPAKDNDLSPISEALLKHATYPAPPQSQPHTPWKRDLFWNKETSQVWFVHLDPFWADFYTSAAPKNRPLPFIGTVPIIGWIHPDKERLCGLLQVSSLISVQLDRSEYVFLLRLMENLKETTTFLALQETLFNPDQQQSVVFGAVLPQVDVSILFPPLAASVQQSMDGESPLADTESIYPDTSSMTDLACLGRSVHNMRVHNSHSEHLLSREASEQQAGSSSTSSITSPVEPSSLTKSQSDSMIDVTATGTVETHVSAAASVASISKVNGAGSTPGTARFVTFAADRPQQPLHSGFTTVKRGFTSLISTVDAALKHSNIADDMSDTMSIRSEASSDSSENYVILHGESEQQDGLAIFRTGGSHLPACASASNELDEVAVEVRADTPTNSDHSSAPVTTTSFMSGRGREVAVVTFHINDLELIHQAVGSESSVRMQAAHLSCNECIAIPKEEFQSKFSSRSRGWREVAVGSHGDNDLKSVAPLRIRMEQKMKLDVESLSRSSGPLKDTVATAADAWLEVSVTNLNLSLLLSSATGLAAFAEDEVLGPMMPMYLSLRNVECTLHEDRPPIRVGGPPPAPAPPLQLRLSHVLVQRSPAGVFSVGVPKAECVPSATGRPPEDGGTSLSSREAALVSRIEALQRENEALRQRLADVSK